MIDRSLNHGRHLIERFLVDAAPYQRVLDLGAGGGQDLMAARRTQNDCHLIGVEASRPNADKLVSQDVEIQIANIERDRLSVEADSIDVVIANQILEHTKEVFWIFDQVARSLRVGGHFILGVPNLASLHNRLLLLAGRQPTSIKNNSAHLRGFTKKDVLALAASGFPEGFALEGFGGSNFYPLPGPVAQPMARALPTLAWGIFFSLKKTREYDGGYLRYPLEHKLETNFWLGTPDGT